MLRTTCLMSLVVAVAGCGAPPERVSPRQHAAHDIEALRATVNYSGTSLTPDGTRVLLTSDETGVYNVYSLPVAGGAAVPLTKSTTDAMRGLGWLDDSRFLFASDSGGDELDHVFLGDESGRNIDLTPGQGLKARLLQVGENGTSLLLATNERDPKNFDVYRYSVPLDFVEASAQARGFSREFVFQNLDGYSPDVASRDLEAIVLSKVRSNKDNDLFVLRAGSAFPALLTPHEGNITFEAEAFAPDGKSLLVTSDEGSDFRRLWRIDLESLQRTLVADHPWDVTSCAFTHDGRYRIDRINEDARTRLELTDVATASVIALPRVGRRRITSLEMSRDARTVVAYAGSSAAPPDLFVGSLHQLDQRTRSLDPSIDPRKLVEAEVVRYPSFDGLKIPALLYRPRSASAGARVPVVVWVHGGPGGQSRATYRPTIQFLVDHGYGVLMVNNRGSSGYGKAFYHLDDRDHGNGDLDDCVYARRYLTGLDWVDGDRVAIMGGSYGGYMVAAALAFRPRAFECGIDIFGVTNWVRTLESIPPWWGAFRESLFAELGDPSIDGERLRAISPLFHAEKIERPLLVVQGANDPRVLQVESDELVAAVRKNGVPVEYVVFEDEGHGFRRRENRISADRAYLDFLDTHLRREGSRESSK